MKRQFQLLFSFSLLFVLGAITVANAQVTPSNSLGIYPPSQPSFDPNASFTAIGESGGVPGPTIDGCDIYGFRAQRDNAAINLGIQQRRLFGSFIVPVPTLTYGPERPFQIIEKGAPSGGGGTGLTGCGEVMAYFRDFSLGLPSSNNVFVIYGSATATGGAWLTTSDRNLKKDIESIDGAIDIVKQLRGVTYEYRVDERPELNLAKGRNYGFITQEVEKVLPELVTFAPDELGDAPADYQVMNYDGIIPVITEAVKEQQVIIEGQEDLIAEQLEINLELEERLDQQTKLIQTLEARLNQLEAQVNGSSANLPSGVSSSVTPMQGVSLRQNRPNPFQGQTMIDYTLPSEMNNAQLAIYDLNGKLISIFDLAVGSGQVTVDASELSGGVYFYAIENNGQTLARQKMIVK